MIKENQQLRGLKRKAGQDLAAEQGKRTKMEQKLEDAIKDSESRKKQYKKKIEEIRKKWQECNQRDKEVQIKAKNSQITQKSTRQG